MPRKVQATFSDGLILTRTTTLPLSYAWRYWGTFGNGTPHSQTGFASSEALAAKAIQSESAYMRTGQYNSRRRIRNAKPGHLAGSEIVAVIEIS